MAILMAAGSIKKGELPKLTTLLTKRERERARLSEILGGEKVGGR